MKCKLLWIFMFSKIPGFIQHTPWQKHLWSVPSNGDKTLYLTFDDGPTAGVTEKVLSILDDFKVKATFFCLGRNAEHYPELINLIRAKGHRIGNHSYSHIKGYRTNTKKYLDDVNLADNVLKSTLFRPPYGRIRHRQAKKLGKKYTIVMWEILSFDYNASITPATCYKNVVNHVQPGSVIVFHDSLKTSHNVLSCLPSVLAELTNRQYQFKTIPENY
ncbi:MAG: polysaccharide deacetylase family protein [Candidatus Delongbacteria bacterium]|nr:polysaccharide deacetylase family protein [Candidatus Delongbacteria bacterium]